MRGRGRQSADLTYRNAITATYRSQLDVQREIEFALAELRSSERVKLAARTFHRSDPRAESYRVECDSGFLSRLSRNGKNPFYSQSDGVFRRGRNTHSPKPQITNAASIFTQLFSVLGERSEKRETEWCEFVGSGSRSRQQEPRYVCVRT